MNLEIQSYNQKQPSIDSKICDLLAQLINKILPEAESKIWHAHPVWFINGNPIVGYAKRKNNTTLLFWSGQSFEEKGLKPEGKFKAAEAKYTDVAQINVLEVEKWLEKSKKIQWDYKNIVKKKGVLDRIL